MAFFRVVLGVGVMCKKEKNWMVEGDF
jgi:hypothetical protein